MYLKGAYRKAGEGVVVRACRDRMRGHGFKLEEGRFRLDVRKTFFTVMTVRHWNRLSSEVVDGTHVILWAESLQSAEGVGRAIHLAWGQVG